MYNDGGFADQSFEMLNQILEEQMNDAFVEFLTYFASTVGTNVPDLLYEHYKSLCQNVQNFLKKNEATIKGIFVIYYLEYGNDNFRTIGEWINMIVQGISTTLTDELALNFDLFDDVNSIIDTIANISTLITYISSSKASGVATSHTPELYLAWMNSFSAKQMQYMFGNVEMSNKVTKLTIACPVDVNFYSSDGSVVASIVGDSITNNTTDLKVSVRNDVKCIQLPKNTYYRIEIVPFAEGTMDVSVANLDNTGSEVQKQYFNDVTLDTSLEYELIRTVDDNGTVVYQLLDSYNQTVANESTITGDIQTIHTQIEVIGNGTAVCKEYVSPGTYITLTAVPEENEVFIGWYIGSE